MTVTEGMGHWEAIGCLLLRVLFQPGVPAGLGMPNKAI